MLLFIYDYSLPTEQITYTNEVTDNITSLNMLVFLQFEIEIKFFVRICFLTILFL